MTTTFTNRISSLALALAASATMLGFAAVPADAAPAPTARVDVAMYDLSRPAGVVAAEKRVAQTAAQVCSVGGVNLMNRREVASRDACVADAMADARAQLQAIALRSQLAAR